MTSGDKAHDSEESSSRTIAEPDVLSDTKRRQVIKGLGALPIAASIAGCSGQDGGSGSNSNSGDISKPEDRGEKGDHGPVVEMTVDAPKFRNYTDVMREFSNGWQNELGVQTEVKSTSWGTYLGMVYIQNDYENVCYSGFGGSPERLDPQFFLSLKTSGQTMNVANTSNEEYDKLYDQLTQAYDKEKRNELVKKLQTYWFEEDASTISYAWSKGVFPANTELWDIKKTKLIGYHPEATKSLITAKPKTDETTLVLGGQDAHQRPNVVAPTSNALDWLFRSVYDTPRRLNFDGTFENWALDSYELKDKTTVDLTLKDGLTFHDGEPLTAEDLKFTFEFLSEYTFGKIDAHVEPVESVSVETDLTARVNLSKPWATFTTSTLAYTWILPKHIWADVPNQVDQPVNWDQQVGENSPGDWAASGPLKVKENATDKIVLETFDDHFAAPEYDRVIYQQVGSEEALRAEMVKGNIHMPVQLTSPSIAEKIGDQGEHIEKLKHDSIQTTCFTFNVENEPTDDITFRKALRAATDPTKIIQVYMRGHGIHSDSTYVHPNLAFGRNDLPTMNKLYDPESARNMLADAGYTWDEKGRLRHPTE